MQPLYDLTPVLRIAGLVILLASGPLAWVWLRNRQAEPAGRLRALTFLILFLTFDLVLFGAFTRLSDSGLGCPDWPGCYGSASPIGAAADIHAAQTVAPEGPVTHRKAWIEMVHRYLAATLGVVVTVLAIASWLLSRKQRAISPWWATATLLGFCVQGAFGALTVTMKLYPAIVTLHLLGGIGLLVLLAMQHEHYVLRPVSLPGRLRTGVAVVTALTLIQITLGGWVSTNYAVLACTDFPTCHGSFWPQMDFEHGFAILRELGQGKDGGALPFEALTAIHYVHRLGAAVVFTGLLWLAWRLNASGEPVLRRWALALAGMAAWQFASGLSNVVLGWPLVAALAHTGGAAALMTLLAVLLTRASLAKPSPQTQPIPAHRVPMGS